MQLISFLKSKIDEALKREEFFTKPIEWLINKGIILSSDCVKCSIKHTRWEVRNGFYYWRCDERSKECPLKLMELSDCFNFCNRIIKDLAMIIYQWSIYGNIGLLAESKEINIESNIVRLAFESLRKVCENTNEFYIEKLSKNNKLVELFVCLCSNQLVIFAFENETMNLKFKIINDKNSHLIASYFKHWIDEDAKVVFYEKRFEFLKKHFKNIEKQRLESPSNHFLNTAFNLIVPNVQDACENQILFNSLLNEVVWRHIFGQTPYSSFLFITSLIKNQPIEYKPFFTDLIEDTDSSFLIDEIYYGRYDQVVQLNFYFDTELRNNTRCHLCFLPLNFQTIFNHLYVTHLKSTKTNRRKSTTSAVDCNHCFTKFNFYDKQLHWELLEGKYKKDGLKTSKTSCKICCVPLKSEGGLVDHLMKYHKYQDHPYACKLCPFRTSFFHEKLMHYKRNHSDIIKAYCRFCLMIFVDDNASVLLYEHLKEHMDSKDSFKCTRCSLSFVSDNVFKQHYLDDHIMQSKKAFNFTTFKYELTNDTEMAGYGLRVRLNKVIISSSNLNGNNKKQRITKKNCFKLGYQKLVNDDLLNKNYIMINDKPIICLECSTPMDANHLSKREMRCTSCNFIGYCIKSLNYPCALHMSGKLDLNL